MNLMRIPAPLKQRVLHTYRESAPVIPQLKVGEGFQTRPGGNNPDFFKGTVVEKAVADELSLKVTPEVAAA